MLLTESLRKQLSKGAHNHQQMHDDAALLSNTIYNTAVHIKNDNLVSSFQVESPSLVNLSLNRSVTPFWLFLLFCQTPMPLNLLCI